MQLPLALRASDLASNDIINWLKRGVWAYFFLLIFEGALRKWILPGLAAPLLIVRDPIALWLVVVAWRRGLLTANVYLTGMVVIGIIGIITATLLGHGSLLIALYGARILLLHFPLMFVVGRVFTREDVIKMGKATLMIAIPMVVLVTLQFYSPQSAWVNRGVGGDMEGAGFSGSMGFFRPPGTFSFTNGNTNFFSFVAPFAFYFWLDTKAINKLLLIVATLALFFAVPLSISRGLLFQVAISLLFVLVASTRKPENLGRLVIAIGAAGLVLGVLSQSSLFTTASEAFTARFEVANESEGGLEGVILDRFLGGLISSLTNSSSSALPFFGYGLGMGTNAGSKLLTGDVKFLIAEGEWGRIIGELGPLMGLSVILLRVGLAIKIARAIYKKLTRGDLLPWMLLSLGLLNVAQGAWAQPSSLGFCTLIGGLMIASLRLPRPEPLVAKALLQISYHD
ncbi:hypothetical protein A8B98_18015 [Hymenobacter sp. UV11]|nr:hypothetical protein A8B98_18015 [Hymenobacter sp. UV11]